MPLHLRERQRWLREQFKNLQDKYPRLRRYTLHVRRRLPHNWWGYQEEDKIFIAKKSFAHHDLAMLVLLHECAHALANPRSDVHCASWRRWFRRLVTENEFAQHCED